MNETTILNILEKHTLRDVIITTLQKKPYGKKKDSLFSNKHVQKQKCIFPM